MIDPISFLFWRLYYFFRDPERNIPEGRVIVSPADGIILYVQDIDAGKVPNPVKNGVAIPLDEWFGQIDFCGKGTLIGIYMTPLSVHFNRAPVKGKIEKIIGLPAKHQHGNQSMSRTFMRLFWRMKPYEEGCSYIVNNARATTVIRGEIDAVMVQIADRWVNRIDCFVQENMTVETGQKVGMIRLGSQCDLYVPHASNIEISCSIGQKVRAGETILGRY